MKFQVKLIKINGDQEEFDDLIGSHGTLEICPLIVQAVYHPYQKYGWLEMDIKCVVKNSKTIVVSTKLKNKFTFKILK